MTQFTFYRTKPRVVNAIQWTGDNLYEVQAFMTPDSPLTQTIKKLGVNTYSTKYGGAMTELTFIEPGGFIVKDELGLHVFTAKAFDAQFELVVHDTASV